MRFYFHVRESADFVPDEEGSELPDIMAARREARISLLELAMQSLRSGSAVNARRIEMAREDGVVLETLSLREVVD